VNPTTPESGKQQPSKTKTYIYLFLIFFLAPIVLGPLLGGLVSLLAFVGLVLFFVLSLVAREKR
jgi:hypothetical protein